MKKLDKTKTYLLNNLTSDQLELVLKIIFETDKRWLHPEHGNINDTISYYKCMYKLYYCKKDEGWIFEMVSTKEIIEKNYLCASILL